MSANTRPIIGINCDYYGSSRNITAHARVNAGYFDAIVKAGGLPILLPPLNNDDLIEAMLDKVDGILLTGGLDMDPRRQSQPGHATIQPMADRRETNDRKLLQQIFDRQLPVLGIGLGMQQLNVFSGGTMFLHIPLECPKAMPHFDPTGAPHRHIVLLEPDTRIEEIYGDGELRVNSRHHQAVNTVGPNMRIVARCPDGVIEAIEGVEPGWFCLGVQWHPEADTASALDMQLFECFVQSTVRESARLQLVA